MAAFEYLNFDLQIESSGEHYRAQVLDAPTGQAETEFDAPFSDLELENFYLRLGRPRSGTRRLDSPEMEAAKRYGSRLFEAIFGDEVYACFHASLAAAQGEGKGLQVRLRVNAPELADLPWEYLYNPRLDQFISLAVATPVTRFLELAQPLPDLSVALPLNVLVLIASPTDHAALDVNREWENLSSALAPLAERGLLKLTRCEEATLANLQRQLRHTPYHIFHFIGHGQFDPANQEGVLLFEDEHGLGRPISGSTLGTLLHNYPSLRLVVLNACEGARTSRSDPYAGVAHSLVQKGLPAVVAMQFEITDQAALTFAAEFYSALSDGYPVSAALAEARVAIFAQENDIEWGTPVLFSRAADGRIFDVPPAALQSAPQAAPAASRPVIPTRGAPPAIFIGTPQPAALPSQPQPAQAAPQPAAEPIRLPWLSEKMVRLGVSLLLGLFLCVWIFSYITSLYESAEPTPMQAALPTDQRFTAPLPYPVTITDARGVSMALVPAGSFQMGSADDSLGETPLHNVYVDAFYMDVYEVTNASYQACVQAGACERPQLIATRSHTRSSYYGNPAYDNYPRIYVNWQEAQTYCTEWRGGRLPSEAEWEKAARGGLMGMNYPWGNEWPICSFGAENGAQSINCPSEDTTAVGSFAPNGYGLYDMAGNVMEWTFDWYRGSYYSTYPADSWPDNPTNLERKDDYRVMRGGSWFVANDLLRVAARYGSPPDTSYSDSVGFRCIISAAAMPPTPIPPTPTPPLPTSTNPVPTSTPMPAAAVAIKLTHDSGSNIQPAFSPDGERIVFISDRDGNQEIYVMNIDGANQQRLTFTDDIQEDVPSFSPDGTLILFGGTVGGYEDLYLMRSDGSQVVNLTNTPGSNEGRPRFSPSGQFIVYDSNSPGNWEIYLANLEADGLGEVVQLTQRPDFNNRLASFSPLGDWIIFRSVVITSSGSNITLVKPDGSGLVSLSSGEQDYYPSISPDGQGILFISERDGSPEIYFMDLSGGNARRLTFDEIIQNYAAFAPQGDWITFAVLGETGDYDICLMPFEPGD